MGTPTAAPRERSGGASEPRPPAPSPEVEGEFTEFSAAAAQFSHEIGGRVGGVLFDDAARTAERNVVLVRTVFSKWNLEILSLLYGLRTLGFEELRRKLHPITPRVLSRKLRFLEERGLVERSVEPNPPIRVRYGLTRQGLTVAKLGEPVILYLHMHQPAPVDGAAPADRPGKT